MSQRIIGIDPGSRITGYGVVERRGNRLIHVGSGAIMAYKTSKDFAERMEIIFDGLRHAIATHKPDIACIENIFYHRNAQSALKLGHARGVAMLAARLDRLELVEYQPTEIKQAVTGNGGANKEQVRKMVCLLLGIPSPPKFDESDALAVAICHLNTIPLLRQLRR
ncbi:MAG: crossover junction endodeoxyribonuclease RuvC [Myxococcales bacterium]|nr:crossover junction endodeoxyribonuclease RuvC [Myxococcales bacterium]